MTFSLLLLALLTIAELALFWLLAVFFKRLKRSEKTLENLRNNQAGVMEKMQANARLEQELLQSFAHRQNELIDLNTKLEERAKELRGLLAEAEKICRSPQFLRELIVTGSREGKKPAELARATGFSVDEVELILARK